MSGKDWILILTEFSAPSILIALIGFIGLKIQRKTFTDSFISAIKISIGFLILGAGAGLIGTAALPIQNALQYIFNISALIPNNDGIPGVIANVGFIMMEASLIMIFAMLLNILMAAFTKVKYVYLTGHVILYMSTAYAIVMNIAFKTVFMNDDIITNIANSLGYIFVIIISGALLMSLYMTISPLILNKYTKKITNDETFVVGHSGNLSFFGGALIGELIGKIADKHHWKIKDSEEIKVPKKLWFLRNTNVSVFLITFIICFVIFLIFWIMAFKRGVTIDDSSISHLKSDITNYLNTQLGMPPLAAMLVYPLTFAAGVEVVLIGVRMFMGELIQSFKGISDKIVKNGKMALDCPTIFPYSPNAVMIGFIGSFVGGIIGLGITLSISLSSSDNWQVVLPMIVPHFFVGGTTGVYANKRGGWIGAIIAALINGIIISFVPFIYQGLNMLDPLNGNTNNVYSGFNGIAWGDTDYLIWLIPASIFKSIGNKVLSQVLLPLLSLLLFVLVFVWARWVYKPKSSTNNVEVTENQLKLETSNFSEHLGHKLVAVCGQGLGSSMLIEMNIKQVIKDLGLTNIEVSHQNVGSFNKNMDDLLAVVCGKDLSDAIDCDNKIVLTNLLDKNEAKTKIINYLNQVNKLKDKL